MWRFDPFEELRRTVDRLNKMLLEGIEPFRDFGTAVDIMDEGDKVKIVADLPGFEKDELEVFFEGNDLVIKAESKKEAEEKKGDFIRKERRYGRVYRKIALPEGINTDSAKASYKNGVLEVTIPKEVGEKKIIPLE
ncbi:MAG: Hsp20/alpha crystallin family protein [Archaeoglobaceae archaeon]|nr:Hsp20/alpha crystallin family protein [Archaeoglobaceae archaeon]MDW8117442.1 Hsp20/alpha crystallin family protein [Archaeoglobaceae archaeon]